MPGAESISLRTRGGRTMKIGLISDTHGMLRTEALEALTGVQQIIHAGDIGDAQVLQQLRSVAPVHAVRGNNDHGEWAQALAAKLVLQFGDTRVCVLHDLKELEPDPATAGFQVVVAGHSHLPKVAEEDGVLFVNPGSAGPRRFKLPVTIGYLTISAGIARAEIRELPLARR